MSKKFLFFCIATGMILATSWVNRSTFSLLYHAYELKSQSSIILKKEPLLQSQIHKFFLTRGIYIPKEDIFSKETASSFLQMHKPCSQGKIHVWIPVRLKIPIFGEKVIEWCMSLP